MNDKESAIKIFSKLKLRSLDVLKKENVYKKVNVLYTSKLGLVADLVTGDVQCQFLQN